LRWSPLAIERASEAAAFIARDDFEAAKRWTNGLFDSVKRLESFPESGRMIPEIGRPEFREIPYGRYRVLYRVQKSGVSILTVRHARRSFDPGEVRCR
jgi:plasmid stabilization system protein ParE